VRQFEKVAPASRPEITRKMRVPLHPADLCGGGGVEASRMNADFEIYGIMAAQAARCE